jgi:hypothetical protein
LFSIISPDVQAKDQEEDTNRREFAITAAAFVAATIADGTVARANSELWERFLSTRQPVPPSRPMYLTTVTRRCAH